MSDKNNTKNGSGKGDIPRKVDMQKWSLNWELINWRRKNKDKKKC